MDKDWKVTLIRQPWLENKTWHDDKARAFARAYSLADLHSCQYAVINASKRIYVFAKMYYTSAGRKS